MPYNFLFLDDGSTKYPTLKDFKEKLGDIDASVISNKLIKDGRRVIYFAIVFNSECPTYHEWCNSPEFCIDGDGWSYRIVKVKEEY